MFNKIPNKEIVELTRVFGLLLYSRISVLQALELIYSRTKNHKLKDIIKNVIKSIKGGMSISRSFAKYPEVFSDTFIANLRVGEETGELPEVISEYSLFLQKMEIIKSKTLQAARYPSMVIIVAISVVIFMLTFILPTFENLFQSAQAELPGLTKVFLLISRGLTNNIYTILIAVSSAVFLLVWLNKSTNIIKTTTDKMLVLLPLLSRMYLSNLLARFSLSMAILLKSRVALVDALIISKSVSSNHLFREQIELLLKKTIKGDNLSKNINSSRFFDPTFSRLLAAGEESAELDKVFYQMSQYYSNQFEHDLDNMTSLLEPVLIIVIGAIVAVILVALYMPMFEILNHFGG